MSSLSAIRRDYATSSGSFTSTTSSTQIPRRQCSALRATSTHSPHGRPAGSVAGITTNSPPTEATICGCRHFPTLILTTSFEVDSVELTAVVLEALVVWEEEVPEETEFVEDCD